MALYTSQFGIAYGSWEAENDDCLSMGIASGAPVKIIQLCWAVVSLCQVIFMLTRAPRVAWEAIYLPLCETITYFLAFTGNGYLRMADGQIFPWARMASWLVTCPVMLGQVSAMALIKYKSLPLNNMMVAASLIRVVMGISATITPNEQLKWMFFFFGVSMLTFEYFCVFTIFSITIADFQEIDTPRSRLVVGRLKILRIVFHSAWTAFPILWVVSSTGLCVLSENISSVCYMLADAACKNGYGLILWNTTWGHLNGKWDREFAKNADKDGEMKAIEEGTAGPAADAKKDEDIKLFGKPVASLRRSSKKKRTDVSKKFERPDSAANSARDRDDDDSRDVTPNGSRVKGDSREDRRREDGGHSPNRGDRRKRYEEDFERYRDEDRAGRRRYDDDDVDDRDPVRERSERSRERSRRGSPNRGSSRDRDDRRYDRRDDEYRSGFKKMDDGRDLEERMMDDGRESERESRANPRDIILSAMQRRESPPRERQ